MKKNPIGFVADFEDKLFDTVKVARKETQEPRKSVVQVYFPHRGTGWAYYNDKFDLKVGDYVYVEGKLEGYRGQVTEVNYSFKIKISDYKKVIALVDTNVKGDFYLAGSHMVSFDRNAIPFSKVITWFKAPEEETEYVIGNDETKFSLEDLSKMKISHESAENGHEYFCENRVGYVEIDGTCGRAIVEGGENYEIEFNYADGMISNLNCSCYCSATCKHEFAAMLQLKETLEFISENYDNEHNGYFAAISKRVFLNIVMNKNSSGKISF